jgi:CRP-like cAMP-binding protein
MDASDVPHLLSREAWQSLLGGAALSVAEWLALNSMATLSPLPAGAPVFTRAQAASAKLLAVLSGQVGLGLMRPDASFQLERTVVGPAWLDLGSAWLGESPAQDARALSPVNILALPLPALRELMAQQPAMAERLLAGQARAMRSLVLMAQELMHKDAEKRLAAWLLQRAQGQVLLQLAERKRDIAAQLAITPETLSRMMRQLKLKGLLEVRGYAVQLPDPAGLARLAEG